MSYSQEDLEELLEHDPGSLVEIAEANEDLKENILEKLLQGEYFELAYEIDPEKTTPLFIEHDNEGAFIYGIQNGYDKLITALDQQAKKEKWYYLNILNILFEEEIPQTYEKIGHTKEFHKILRSVGDKLADPDDFEYFGEFYQAALEKNDASTLNIIAHALKEEEPLEAWMLAKKTGDDELAEELEEMLGMPEIQQYHGILTTAYDLIRQVSQHFGTELPKKILPGGPEGSYATIQYKKFGEVQYAYGVKSSA